MNLIWLSEVISLEEIAPFPGPTSVIFLIPFADDKMAFEICSIAPSFIKKCWPYFFFAFNFAIKCVNAV